MQLSKDISRTKARLIAKAKTKGLCENFGDKEVSSLMDKYSDYNYGTPEQRKEYSELIKFSEWVYSLDEDKLRGIECQRL